MTLSAIAVAEMIRRAIEAGSPSPEESRARKVRMVEDLQALAMETQVREADGLATPPQIRRGEFAGLVMEELARLEGISNF